MTKLTQLERARKVVAQFVPKDKPEDYFVYIYLGAASHDATLYSCVADEWLQKSPVWFIDFSKLTCVYYVGLGKGTRQDDCASHPPRPPKSSRIILKSNLSFSDAFLLEKHLINELGCLLDASFDGGSLVNVLRWHSGPRVCPRSEYSIRHQSERAHQRWAQQLPVTYALDSEKNIVCTGTQRGIAKHLQISPARVGECLSGERIATFAKSLNRYIYFCLEDEYDSFTPQPISQRRLNVCRPMIAINSTTLSTIRGPTPFITKLVPALHRSSLHRACRGELKQTAGWLADYLD
jgi:hypothetical protein